MRPDRRAPLVPENTDLEKCLRPLLGWLKWKGSERELLESKPHMRSISSVEDFRTILQHLGFESDTVFVNLRRLDARLFPCLFVPSDGGAPKVLHEMVGERISYFDSETSQSKTEVSWDLNGFLVVFRKLGTPDPLQKPSLWFKNALQPRKKLLNYVIFLTFIQTVLMMLPAIFVISIYDKIIPAGSYEMLSTFSLGIFLALFMLAVVMMIRYRLLGYLGVYIQQDVGNSIFQQLLWLPPVYTESAPVGAQIARINDFNSVRDFFGNPLFGTLIESPFIVIYFFAIWIIGGLLVLIPLIAAIFSILVALVMWHLTKNGIWKSSRIQVQQQNFLVETLWGMRSVQYAGLQNTWKTRFRELNSEATLCGQRLQQISVSSDAIFDFIMMLSGVATLVAGSFLVMDNATTIGSLIGVMFIVWRILTPVKTLSMMLPKLIQLKRSIRQINELMRLQPERELATQKQSTPSQLIGAISFSQVTFRYPGADTAALSDISFSLKPREMLAIIGPSASGKSTMVNLMLAMYLPQGGHVYIDGRNIRQYDVAMLRTHIAYVSQKAEVFYGTIAQNLRLADPMASMDQLREAAQAANLLRDIEALPEGFDTRIKDYGDKKLGTSFCQKINLARAYLRNASILILDEPMTALDVKSADTLLNFLKEIKGKKTIVVITHQRAYVQLADLIMVLLDGKQVMQGPVDQVFDKIPKGLI
ncbi:MAG: hypothetical protein A3I77_08420 [Gammaproteobacteria bacterium RIFCSPLOWO2_02_FULL_42_14]|nr:MAG: hypothetical protein A3B71_07045 [Gammaproteobacteria bacterium RIFCSPHIGHO2_02_FULL_42_43]OGT53599.1 MAG: hypothetical protein A3E54_02625 [Gammaproteobacteria bacterium RIFCSPHIGHO2_12_FULL_41_25]OGT61650.1 MAG: hypothetical protein A3I77_08420 [Gammaproteobacteria bacterium RIFCSPLOWO2_02_FULL_42_14]OGT85409.1 MAG: hypothetical protein A3G86_08130 [Gammaproteobacteria bacterium RIFCSPLOWO2_12_FULL_42_18]